MSHTIELPEELYRAIEHYAAERGETAQAVILDWAMTNSARSGPDNRRRANSQWRTE